MGQVPLDQFKSNLRDIAAHFRANWPRSRIILLTPSTLDKPRIETFDASLGIPVDLTHPRTPENARLYADGCIEVGKQLDIPVIDVFDLHSNAMQRGGKTLIDLYWDGLHYSPEGYSVSPCVCPCQGVAPNADVGLQIINAAIMSTIRETSPDLVPSAMEDAFPFFATYENSDDPRSARLASLAETIKAKLAAQEEEKSRQVTEQSEGLDRNEKDEKQPRMVTALEAAA